MPVAQVKAGARSWTWAALRRDVVAGLAGTVASLPNILSQGLLAFAVLGLAGPGFGIPAAFVSVVIGGVVFAALARGPMPAGGPASSSVLILSALVAEVAADPGFDLQRPGSIADLMALTGAAVVGTGLIQWAFALLGVARLAKFVPQPVLAGFMNGVAVLIILAQLPLLLGGGHSAPAPAGTGWLGSVQGIQAGTLAVGVFTIVCILAAPRLTRHLPAPFVGLILGSLAYFALSLAAPGLALGPLVGPLAGGLPYPDALRPWLDGSASPLLQRHFELVVVTAALMAMIGTLDQVLNGLAVDQVLRARTDPQHELLALGAANVVSGLFAGLPVVLLRARALQTAAEGGRSPWAVHWGAAMFLVLALAGASLLAWIPQVVLAGVMVVIAWRLIDPWSGQLVARYWAGQRTTDVQVNLAVIAVVCIVTVVFSFVVGVLVGAVLAVVLFIRSMNRWLLRGHHTAAMQPSRRIYAPDQETVLKRLREGVAVLELEGALFFGSADRLAAQVELLAAECRMVILDFRRVTVIDASGAVVLSQIRHRLEARSIGLSLAGVTPTNRHGQALREFTGTGLSTSAWYPDVDHAVEAAEQRLLAEHEGLDDPLGNRVPLARCGLMEGLDEAQVDRLAARLERRRLAAGEVLFRQGDRGDRLYVVTAGSISISADVGEQGLRQRFVSVSPGMMFGEVALLDHGSRSADALADVDSEVYALSEAALQALRLEDPLLCAQLYRNVARHLSERLRAAAWAWRASAS